MNRTAGKMPISEILISTNPNAISLLLKTYFLLKAFTKKAVTSAPVR